MIQDETAIIYIDDIVNSKDMERKQTFKFYDLLSKMVEKKTKATK